MNVSAFTIHVPGNNLKVLHKGTYLYILKDYIFYFKLNLSLNFVSKHVDSDYFFNLKHQNSHTHIILPNSIWIANPNKKKRS